MKRKVCKKCKLFVKESVCPICQSSDLSENWRLAPKDETLSDYLKEIGDALPRQMGTSQILLDGIVQVVTDNSIIIIKRNQKRFWTRSLAREDAESTLNIRMFNTMPVKDDIE